jgi:hypothetical protein
MFRSGVRCSYRVTARESNTLVYCILACAQACLHPCLNVARPENVVSVCVIFTFEIMRASRQAPSMPMKSLLPGAGYSDFATKRNLMTMLISRVFVAQKFLRENVIRPKYISQCLNHSSAHPCFLENFQ